jgi:hypothetical protein
LQTLSRHGCDYAGGKIAGVGRAVVGLALISGTNEAASFTRAALGKALGIGTGTVQRVLMEQPRPFDVGATA